jgi:hypothetical protein
MKQKDRIRRRDFMKAGVLAMAASGVRGQPLMEADFTPAALANTPSKFGEANALEISKVTISGSLDKRIRLGLKFLLAERVRILGGEGHSQGWGADAYGRWIDAVSQAAAYTGDHIPELEETVRELIDAQEANGFWGGNAPNTSWTWWGASRAMVGLTEYWGVSRDAEALRSAKKLGELYLEESRKPSFDPRGGIEPVVGLWRITGDVRYLDAAEKMAAYAITNHKLDSSRDIATHVDFLIPLRGFVELFLATGKGQYLQGARDLYARTLQQDMWVTGGVSEILDNPFEARDETCPVADWLRLSLKLGQATREAGYYGVAERTLLNHLYFDQDHSGGFCSWRSVAPPAREDRDFVTWWCCAMHGVREMLEAIKFIYTHVEDSIDVNLFTPSKAEVRLRNGVVRLEQTTAYPSEFKVGVEVKSERELSFRLRVRVPQWSRSFKVTLNGEPMEVDSASGYATIARSWKPGDTVQIDLEPYFQLVPEGTNGFSTTHPTPIAAGSVRMDRAALTYGPLVLMVDPALCVHQMFEWEGVEIMVPRRENGELFLPDVQTPIPGRGEYSVPRMCFMALGRNLKVGMSKSRTIFDPDQREIGPESPRAERPDPEDESWKLVFLVPVSEITDRWTPTVHRMVPYEVRNNAWLLGKNQTEELLARTRRLCDSFVQQRKLNTTGYAIRLANRC